MSTVLSSIIPSFQEYLRGRDTAESEAATEDLMHNKFSFSQDYRTISVRQTVQRSATTGNVKDGELSFQPTTRAPVCEL